MEVSRQIIGMVIRGASTGGRPLYGRLPPGADEVANAFVGTVIARANTVGLNLSVEETREVWAWFSLTDKTPPSVR